MSLSVDGIWKTFSTKNNIVVTKLRHKRGIDPMTKWHHFNDKHMYNNVCIYFISSQIITLIHKKDQLSQYLHFSFTLTIYVPYMYNTYVKVWREYSTGMYIRDVLCLPHGIPASIWVFGLNSHHTPSMVCFIDINFFYE